MVNAVQSNNCIEMGAATMRKQEQSGPLAPSLFSKQIDMNNKVYKLLIHIEKIRPKPCPKSKKMAFLTVARKLEQIKAGFLSAITVGPGSLPRKAATCQICKQMFQSAQSLYLHKKKQHWRICSICNMECATMVAAESHKKMHESNDPDYPYKCHLCPRTFDSTRNTKLHVRVMHSQVESQIEKSEPTATRDAARQESPRVRQIVKPAERMDEREYSEKIKEQLNQFEGRSAGNYSGATFTCQECGKGFASVEAAESHTMDHMDVDKEYKCSICKKLFKSETTLNDHLAEHLSRALRCSVCPKAFINRATLRIHMKSHGQG